MKRGGDNGDQPSKKRRDVRPTSAPSMSDRGGPSRDRRGAQIKSGVICAWDAKKNFGFIKSPGVHEDIFVPKEELPPELQRAQRREDVMDQRVDFEIETRPDGKLRASNCRLQGFQSPMQGMGPPPSPYGYGMPATGPPPGARRQVGKIRKFDRTKGFGFLVCKDGGEDVFFLPSSLPQDMREARDSFEGMEMTFEVGTNDEGKPRANNMMPLHQSGYSPYGPMGGPMVPMGPPMGSMGAWMGPPMGGPMGPPMGPPMGVMMPGPPLGPMGHMIAAMGAGMGAGMGPIDGQVFYGAIVRYDPGKGFGFIFCQPLDQDLFFLRSEMPAEIREEGKDKVVGVQVEFEIGHRDDGKLRANRLAIVPPEHTASHGQGRQAGRCIGRIVKYDDAKSYGFIASHVLPDDIFFMRSVLPKEQREMGSKDLVELDVSFELGYNAEGKPRAQALEILPEGHERSAPVRREGGTPLDGGRHIGVIVRFDPKKGFGFLEPRDINEDVFFQRSEMPDEIRGAQTKEEVLNREVEFEVKTMPDGKLRAMSMVLASDAGPVQSAKGSPDKKQPDAGAGALDVGLVDEMTDFLLANGGSYDYGKFANRFQGVKKKQLETHFSINGQNIELSGQEPGSEDDREESDVKDGAPANNDDPAILLGPGICSHGVIRSYTPSKGFGFILCAGIPEDIYFSRNCLPSNFQGNSIRDMPNLEGVQVSFSMAASDERGPKADRVDLLVKWHSEDRCWLLKREADPTL